MAADLILHNAQVFTGGDPWPGGVAVEGGRILAVGSDADLRSHSGPGTDLIDCRNGLLTPGFIDAHVHPVTGGLKLLRCNLDGASNSNEAIAKIADYAYAHPALEWIWGGGWAMEWFERGTPAASALDAVVANRPVFLYNRDGHGAWVNSLALSRAGIDGSTPDPSDGRIERLPNGTPLGTLHEGAMGLVERIIPQPRPREWEAALKTGQRYLLSFGVTGWQDADVRPEQDGAYLSLAGRGELIASVVGALWWDRERGVDQIEELLSRRAAMAPRYRPTTVKLMLDGVAENYTASMLEPYLDTDGQPGINRGIDFIDPTALPEIVTKLDRLGFQCHFHAIGDRAVRNALDAIQASRAQNGDTGSRHDIAHLQFVNALDWPRFRHLGVAANIQPYWACAEAQVVDLTLPFVSPEQSEHMYPFGSLLRAGAALAMGSDWSVSTPDIMQQIEVAVTRRSPDHREADPLIATEALTLQQALSAASLGSARINRVEDRAGSIEPGKDADLVVFDRNPFAEPPIGDARVRLTIVGGRVVYKKN